VRPCCSCPSSPPTPGCSLKPFPVPVRFWPWPLAVVRSALLRPSAVSPGRLSARFGFLATKFASSTAEFPFLSPSECCRVLLLSFHALSPASLGFVFSLSAPYLPSPVILCFTRTDPLSSPPHALSLPAPNSPPSTTPPSRSSVSSRRQES
jgi:hypothetical protein